MKFKSPDSNDEIKIQPGINSSSSSSLQSSLDGDKKSKIKYSNKVEYGRTSQYDETIKYNKRYNNLIKSDEDDVAFWQSMKNTNKSVHKTESDDCVTDHPQETDKSKDTENNKNTAHKVSSETKKYRTKTYDKHHQKDKNLKKLNL